MTSASVPLLPVCRRHAAQCLTMSTHLFLWLSAKRNLYTTHAAATLFSTLFSASQAKYTLYTTQPAAILPSMSLHLQIQAHVLRATQPAAILRSTSSSISQAKRNSCATHPAATFITYRNLAFDVFYCLSTSSTVSLRLSLQPSTACMPHSSRRSPRFGPQKRPGVLAQRQQAQGQPQAQLDAGRWPPPLAGRTPRMRQCRSQGLTFSCSWPWRSGRCGHQRCPCTCPWLPQSRGDMRQRFGAQSVSVVEKVEMGTT